MKIASSVLVVSAVLVLSGCSSFKSYQINKFEKLETWQLCKQMLEGRMRSDKDQAWANEVIAKRGDSCEPYIGKFSPPAQISREASSTSKSESRKLKKLERENQKRKNRLDELERKQREDAMWKSFNCSNAAWRKGYC